MAHRGVIGRVVFSDNNQGVPELDVRVVDVYPIPDNDLGHAKTDANGDFTLLYSPDDYQRWESRSPNIRIRIYGPVQRQLIDQTFEAVSIDILDFTNPPIEIHRNNIGEQDPANDPASKAWLVTNATLDLKKGDAINLSEGNIFKPLIDGTTLFPEVTKVAREAKKSINLMNLHFRIGKNLDAMRDKDFLITNFTNLPDPTAPVLGVPLEGEKIQEILVKKAKGGNGEPPIPVRVIVADEALTRGDSVEQVTEFFAPSQVQTRIANYGIEVLHGRTVVVDGEKAFVLGSSLDQNYFSSPHLIRDARHRGSLIHDVGGLVTGPAVAPIDETFATVWNQAGPAPQLTPQTRSSGSGEIAMQVLRTMPGNSRFPSPFPGAQPIQHGETSVLEAYQRAIARAQDFIYIEDQYFTNSAIVDALINRMKKVTTLQLILVLNLNPEDFPGYTRKQIKNIKLIRKKIPNPDTRFKVFTLWTTQISTEPERAKKPFEIMNISVHSKVAIIDDKWATIGTANLDGSGLNAIEISDVAKAAVPGPLLDVAALILGALINGVAVAIVGIILGALAIVIAGVILFTGLRDLLEEAIRTLRSSTQHANPSQAAQPARHVELNIVLYNGVAGLPTTNAIKAFREELWSEHLGLTPAGFPSRPGGGWAELWSTTAQAKIDNVKAIAISGPGPTLEKANVVEWKPETKARIFLKAHGIDVRDRKVKLTIRKKADVFNFVTGQWEKNKF
ncbi:MAG: phospholipase D-like domain-containing protein [Verrucomicrobiales bacterium]|nr:phospholipase D-like domain-containing protein [Verrucomicrobiales bacterium]